VHEERSDAENKQDSDHDPFAYSLRISSPRFMDVPAVMANDTAGKLGPVGLSVGFQARSSVSGIRDASTRGNALDYFPRVVVVD
jgi:hypothetical protein